MIGDLTVFPSFRQGSSTQEAGFRVGDDLLQDEEAAIGVEVTYNESGVEEQELLWI
jgi:hypothetical protein